MIDLNCLDGLGRRGEGVGEEKDKENIWEGCGIREVVEFICRAF